MIEFCTIQKLSEESGIDPSSVRLLIKDGKLTAHKIKGFKRIFVNIDQYNSLIRNESEEHDADIDLDDFLIF